MDPSDAVQAEGIERPSRTRWLIFALACGASWLLYLHRYSWGVIKPALKEEHSTLTSVQLGWLDSAFSLTYAIGQIPGGLAADFWGPRIILSLLILLWSLTVAGLGLAVCFWSMMALMLAFGITQAGAYPNLSKVTRNWFPFSIRTSIQGVVAVLSGRAGGACSSLLVATLLIGTWGLSWRHALLVIAGMGVTFSVIFWMLFRNNPRVHPWSNEAEQRLVEEDQPISVPLARSVLRLDPPNLLNLSALLLQQFASAFADNLYVFWIPLFLVEEKELNPIQMGIFASLPLWGGAVGGMCARIRN